MSIDEILKLISTYLTTYGLKVVGALIIFVIGRWVAKLVSKLVSRAMSKSKVDKTLGQFAANLTYALMLVFVIIAALATAGIQTTSFIAIIGAAGLAVGLALQGSLANFAAGVLMMVFKPMKVGDFVEIAGTKGTVQEIQIFNTLLNTPDNVRTIIPNAKITGDNIKNYSATGTRRVDMVIGVSYNDDLKKTKEILEGILNAEEKILKEPAYTVAVSELGDSSVNLVVRPWVKTVDYWDVHFRLTQTIKETLDENGISIPYPQRDVHMIPADA